MPEARNLHRNRHLLGRSRRRRCPIQPSTPRIQRTCGIGWSSGAPRAWKRCRSLTTATAPMGPCSSGRCGMASPIDRAYAELRSRNEPLVEITQSRASPRPCRCCSPNDELAGFELMTSYIGVNKPITKFEGGYVRDALKRGLRDRESARRQSLQVGICRGQRQSQFRRRLRRGPLLLEGRRARWITRSAWRRATRRLQELGGVLCGGQDRAGHFDLGICRSHWHMGGAEHARVAVRSASTQGNVCYYGPAHPRAAVRGL